MSVLRKPQTLYFGIVAGWATVLAFIILINPHFSFHDLVVSARYCLYAPDVGIATGYRQAKINLYTYFYLLVILCSLSVWFVHKHSGTNLPRATSRPLTQDLLIIWILVAGLQVLSHYHSFYNEFRIYQGKTTGQKNQLLLNDFYGFIDDCRTHVPDGAAVDYITDLDVTQDPGMFINRFMAYFIYPIDLLHIKRSDSRYCILILERSHDSLIPKDQTILTSRPTVITGKAYLLLVTAHVPQ